MKYSQLLRFSLLSTYLLRGIPNVWAFAQSPTLRFSRQRRATTSIERTSRPLFWRSQTFPTAEKQFHDDRETAATSKESLQVSTAAAGTNESSTGALIITHIQLLQNQPLHSLCNSRSATRVASLLAAIALYGFIKSGQFSYLFRHTNWFLQNAFHTYENMLVSRPLRTKAGTGAILAILGDALAQSTTNRGSSYDKRRAASFAIFDSCYRVFQHNMFPSVIALCQGTFLARLGITSSIGAAVERTMVYQLLVVPLIYYPSFFAFTGCIQGLNIKQSIERMRSQFFRCWRRNLVFWIPTQMVLFGVVDEHFQIPFACVMGMLWSAILSLTAGNTTKESYTTAALQYEA